MLSGFSEEAPNSNGHREQEETNVMTSPIRGQAWIAICILPFLIWASLLPYLNDYCAIR